jgi:hypothetical protein
METTPPPDFTLPRCDYNHASRSTIERFDLTPMEQRLQNIVRDVAPGSGRWFLDDTPGCLYASYHQPDEPKCYVLWLHGDDGVGKQTLSAIMAHKILDAPDPQLALGWFSCSRFDHKRRKSENILRTLAIQVAR